MSGPDYIVDLTGRPQPRPPRRSTEPRPWLAMRWRCCSVYSRVYRNRAETAYEGRCPRCGRSVSVKIGSDGTSARFFEAH